MPVLGEIIPKRKVKNVFGKFPLEKVKSFSEFLFRILSHLFSEILLKIFF